jgi:glycosyltransferase involved in cell wall biosynthesis
MEASMAKGLPRRILQCEFCEDGTAGGSHQALYDTVRLMDRRRFEPVVVFYEDNRFVAPLRELGATVHVWKRERKLEREPHIQGRRLAKIGSIVGAVRRRVRLLRESRIDLVHLNNTPFLGFDDWLPAAHWLGLPCITTVMGRPYQLPTPRIQRALTLRFDRLIAISDNVLESLREGGYPEAMLTKVNLGIDIEAFTSRVRVPAERVRAQLGVAPDRMLVVMVGNLRQWKGHHVVVSALEQMDAEVRQRLHVAFVGAARPEDQAYLSGLRERLARAGASQAVSWLGGREDVPDLVAAADVALHASTFPEPFGLVLVEAMALGKPLIAARRGGPIEVVTPETGILFDPDDPSELVDALERLLEQPDLRKAMGTAAQLRAGLFTAQRMTEGMQRVWEELLSANGASRVRS